MLKRIIYVCVCHVREGITVIKLTLVHHTYKKSIKKSQSHMLGESPLSCKPHRWGVGFGKFTLLQSKRIKG